MTRRRFIAGLALLGLALMSPLLVLADLIAAVFPSLDEDHIER